MGWFKDNVLTPVRERLSGRDLQTMLSPEESMIIGPSEYAKPVKESSKVAEPAKPDTLIYGATGTPIMSGFVNELGEYNPELKGRNGITIYEKMRRSDADVAAILAACKLPIRAAEYQVVPGVKANEPEYEFAKEIAEFVEDSLFGGLEYENSLGMRFSQRWESVIENALLCLDFGCSGHEDIWTIDGDNVRLSRLAPRLPLTFYRFHIEDDGDTLKAVEQWGYRGASFVTALVPADKFTLFSLNQEGANFYGRSVLRSAYQHWYTKNALYRIDAIAAERNGMGVPTIIMGPNAAEQDKTTAMNWANYLAAHESTSLVLPNGWTFELVSVKGRPKDLMPSVQHHSEMICRSVLAMFMTLGSSQSGSRALGSTMVDFFQLSEEATAKFICDNITETTIRRLVDFNFSRKEGKLLPYPKLVTPNLAVLNPLDMFTVLKDLATSDVDLLQPDDETEDYIRKKAGLPIKGKPRTRGAAVKETIKKEGDGGTSPGGDPEVSPTDQQDVKNVPSKEEKRTPGAKPDLKQEKQEPSKPSVEEVPVPKTKTETKKLCETCGSAMLGGPGSGCQGANCGRPAGSSSDLGFKPAGKELTEKKALCEKCGSELLGGPGSGCSGSNCGRPSGSGGAPTRAELARLSFVPATKEMQAVGDHWQNRVAKILGAKPTPGNAPADVIVGKNALEVKTIQTSKKDRVEMRPDSRARKEAFVKEAGMKGHTVAIDLRGGSPKIYYREGFGAYRFGSMERVSSISALKTKLLN